MHTALIKLAKERFQNRKAQIVHFTDNADANALLNDLETYPHAFVLACLMDRQIKAERAWYIPYLISQHISTFSISGLRKLSQADLTRLFKSKSLHRFNETMAGVFYKCLRDIETKYNGNASKIWAGRPSSSSVVYRFLEFEGGGRKIATMAANILARQFRIPFSDYYSIDISPDVHVVRVMKRMGLVPKDATIEMITYKARELYPDFPGIIDFSCWDIGRQWCKPQKPLCQNCIVGKHCEKKIERG